MHGGWSAGARFEHPSHSYTASLLTPCPNRYPNSTHDNSISCMTVEAATPLSQSFVSTSGVDGKLVVWKLGSIPGLELA